MLLFKYIENHIKYKKKNFNVFIELVSLQVNYFFSNIKELTFRCY